MSHGICARSVTSVTASVKVEIARVHSENYGVYGIRKIHAQLGREGVTSRSAAFVSRSPGGDTAQRLNDVRAAGGRRVSCPPPPDNKITAISAMEQPTVARLGRNDGRRTHDLIVAGQ